MRGYMYRSTISFICTSFLFYSLIQIQEVVSSEKGKNLWSLKKISSVEPPIIEKDSWSSNAIDKFILKRLQDSQIKPNPSAEKLTIIRRVSFDLLGLAPSREDIEGFLADNSKGAYDKVLDKLLSSPHYGERWGRHWLDVARFGESHGYESDNERPHGTYRDAVIRAFNQDLPFDRFVKWQVAGDILEPQDSLAVTLTGFLSAGSTVTNVDGVDREKANYDKMDDIVSATGSAFLGLTVGCTDAMIISMIRSRKKIIIKWLIFSAWPRGDRQVEIGEPGSKVKAMVWNGGKKRSNPILKRGDVEQKGEDVGIGVLTALSENDGDTKEWINQDELNKSDGRNALAHWLTDPAKGSGHLLARVIVNRIWQHHFGEGLVKTSNNFGQVGDEPSHPELLDWLALQLMNEGWKIKPIHKLIMKSSTYLQSVDWDQNRYEIDPQNKLYWRKKPRRLEGEIIRDSIMNTAGTLNRKLYGPSVKPWCPRTRLIPGLRTNGL